MVNWLHTKQEERLWTTGEPGEGVVLKKGKGCFVSCPNTLLRDGSGLVQKIAELNVRVAMTVSTRVIQVILANNNLPWVDLSEGLRLQVIPDLDALPHCQKHQSAAFISSSQKLLVWEDDPRKLLERSSFIQERIVEKIWGNDPAYPQDDVQTEGGDAFEKEDLEGQVLEGPREMVLVQAWLTAAMLILVIAAIGGGWRQVAIEIYVDRNYLRFIFAACILPQIWLALFFFQALVGNIAQLIGPVGNLKVNTKFYSGIAPRRLDRNLESGLPHVTIQMPVYKEGLKAVIAPTIKSVKAAISTYELQGGTANIFVNDDGMQHLDEKEQAERQEFYDEHNIGWVARPKHHLKQDESPKSRWNPKNWFSKTGNQDGNTDYFNRRGKFKKASNMNYGLWVSAQVEDTMAGKERTENWNQIEENKLYKACLDEVVDASGHKTWADGNIRIGDYILLVDSDTRVPEDCFLDAVSEMERSPQVSIIQYSSGVMNVTKSFFEKGITFFTNLIYTQIQYAVANGDVAPFVGHNAILRWSALQDIAYQCPEDGYEKYWSEHTVSEDFDMALRLQTTGYHVRLGAYKGQGFKEGVSLTVYDELARWEKYAYGCNELIFHPLKHWLTKGPFTPLFIKFIFSNMPLASKFTIMAYIGTYYALGSAWLLTLMNYFLVGWFNGHLDHYYIDSFKVYFAIILVFTALGNVSLAVLRYRIGEKSILDSLFENLSWIPLLVIFLGGISLHVSQAILSHFFSIEMTWGATAKEVENISFFREIPRVLTRFRGTFVACVVGAGMMGALATWVPDMWKITFFTPIWPLASVIICHFLLPIVLNPNLMRFTW
ncbi:glycosyl transferase family group 2-domain-containing protein [Clohesyomyces aquaticus]|uniref:Glycosyl transferase family group 2-domain-containing protein n=1 Tax=Clohesyomyces aquaticus TaxID=1231657 RepID=A0A1Y1ZDS3_9PLEO|nr:glycosyl transferase family group 2-domain-containing protein [Clohesyomyces aquaticus]